MEEEEKGEGEEVLETLNKSRLYFGTCSAFFFISPLLLFFSQVQATSKRTRTSLRCSNV